MEKTKHTPGPWEIGSYLEDPFGNDYEVKTIFQVTPQRTRYICDILGGANPKIKKEIETNARLIATAPDLLEVLKELFNLLEENQDTARFYLKGHYNRAKAAIAKAEGRE